MRRVLLSGLLLALVAGCATSPERGSQDAPAARRTTPTPTVAPAPLGTPAQAEAQLAQLSSAPRRPPVGYLRSAFGTSWRDTDRNGCNQRDDVLLRDAVPGTVKVGRQGSCDHDVLAGSWHDPYTARTLVFTDLKDLHQAQAIQIDHIVPLAEAWTSGASAWSGERRSRFANYLPELLAVDGPTNASKGDGDPAAWRPRKAFQCRYAIRWIAIKTRWRLAADPSEETALRQMLGYC